MHIFKGSRFVNTHPEEITVASKAIYLALTTLIGARTLGEEYVDLIYVNRKGNRFPRLLGRLGFLLSYAVLPYLVTRFIRRIRPNVGEEQHEQQDKLSTWGKLTNFLTSYPKVLDTLLNLHIAIFYFQGEFYSLSKRIFGLRYAFGHNKDRAKLQSATGNYSFLGALILLQFMVKSLFKFKSYTDEKKRTKKEKELQLKGEGKENEVIDRTKISEIQTLDKFNQELTSSSKKLLVTSAVIDLTNSEELPYLPENSRSCMLCLSPMVNPSAAVCGHLFCWECIVDWVREHPECPLCRQQCLEQNLLPLR